MQICLNDLKIGDDQPCRVIAEIANNHMGSIATALEMATQAKRCGADIVKSQFHDINDKRRWRRSLIIGEHVQLMQHCKEIGIEYLCTPFTIEAAKELDKIGLPAFKIGSGQSGDSAFVGKMALLEKPILMSIKEFYLPRPRPNNKTMLLSVDGLKPLDHNPVYYSWADGYSCHSPTIYPALAAVALGAKIVEKHVIWDKKQICPDQYNSIDFNQLKELVVGIKEIEEKL